ncbi:PKHD-type hydroxylase [Kibdelosporangium banguiense]|uniref:PKHD-type hydroxylase n=1 Tax=Kibdelosporangium banguiense TaxID=1365924 RepID=A0ABS4TF83_9PSEU|nr:2OG-Fe(II) oxygenase [Kibdelosporangium banguiense]MBP2322644.1 PKHD-type hydroxylase [Kibdelosporangium banguiense]
MRGPLVVENVLPEQLRDDLLSYFRSTESLPRSYQGVVDQSQRNCAFVEVPAELADVVLKLVADRVDEYFGIESAPIDGQPQLIYRYGIGVGFVTHHDEVTEVELERAESNGQPVIGGDLTTLLFLNGPDAYEGGALYFEQPPLELRPPQGTLVAFPATRDFMHGVKQIDRGERFSLLARRSVVRVVAPLQTVRG